MTIKRAKGLSAYPPKAFQEHRLDVLTAAIRRIVFGHLVTVGPEGPLACGAPFVVRDGPDGYWLEAHLSRANPQSRASGVAALILFQGPHAYVRPGWYPSKLRDGRAVPTWNSISVQVKGRLEVIEDDAWLHAHLAAISHQQEGGLKAPWSPSDAPSDYVTALSRGILGVRLRPACIEGVWKLSQNHSEENRNGVISALREIGDDNASAVAEAMEAGNSRP